MTTTPHPTPEPIPSPPAATARRPLARSSDDRVIAGVCGGIAEHTGIDVALVRVLAVIAAVFTVGGAALAYVAAYAVMAEPDGRPSPVDRWQQRRRR